MAINKASAYHKCEMGKPISRQRYSPGAKSREDNQSKQDECTEEPEPPLEAGGVRRQGWMLIVGGLMMIVCLAFSPYYALYWFHFPFLLGLAFLAIVAGLKLAKRQRLDKGDKDV